MSQAPKECRILVIKSFTKWQFWS